MILISTGGIFSPPPSPYVSKRIWEQACAQSREQIRQGNAEMKREKQDLHGVHNTQRAAALESSRWRSQPWRCLSLSDNLFYLAPVWVVPPPRCIQSLRRLQAQSPRLVTRSWKRGLSCTERHFKIKYKQTTRLRTAIYICSLHFFLHVTTLFWQISRSLCHINRREERSFSYSSAAGFTVQDIGIWSPYLHLSKDVLCRTDWN